MGDEKESELEKAIREAPTPEDREALRRYAESLQKKGPPAASTLRDIARLREPDPKHPDYGIRYVNFPIDHRPYVHLIVSAKQDKKAEMLRYADFLGDRHDPKEGYIRAWMGLREWRAKIVADPDNQDTRNTYRRLMDGYASKLEPLNETDTRAINLICPGASLIQSAGEYVFSRAEAKRRPYVHTEKPKDGFFGKFKKGLFGSRTVSNSPNAGLIKLNDRADELVNEHIYDWLRKLLNVDIPQRDLKAIFADQITCMRMQPGYLEDGLPTILSMPQDMWLKYGEHLLSRLPIRTLVVTQVTDLNRVVAIPGMERLTALGLSFGRDGRNIISPDQITVLANAPRLARLETLGFRIMNADTRAQLQYAATPSGPLADMEFTDDIFFEMGEHIQHAAGSRHNWHARACAERFGFGPRSPEVRIGQRRPDGTRPDRNEPREEGR